MRPRRIKLALSVTLGILLVGLILTVVIYVLDTRYTIVSKKNLMDAMNMAQMLRPVVHDVAKLERKPLHVN